MKFHTENLLTWHALILAAAPAADTLALGKWRETLPRHGRYGWPIRTLSLVTVIVYVLAGIAKLRNVGWDWATGEVLRSQIAFDNLRKIELGSVHSPLGAKVVLHTWLFPPLSVMTLLVELGAPAALLHRRIAKYWVMGAWLFHIGVAALMTIVFLYPLSMVPYLPFFKVEKILQSPKLRAFSKRAESI